jgi:hypothetical protein
MNRPSAGDPPQLVTVAMLEAAAHASALHTWADAVEQQHIADKLARHFQIFAMLKERRNTDRINADQFKRFAKQATWLSEEMRRLAQGTRLHPFGWSEGVAASHLNSIDSVARSATDLIAYARATKKDNAMLELMRRLRSAYVELFAVDWHRTVDPIEFSETGKTLAWLRSLITTVGNEPGAPAELAALAEHVNRFPRGLDLSAIIRRTILLPGGSAWADARQRRRRNRT